MSLYELNDLIASYQSILGLDFSIYLSIVSAYLIASYLIGPRLTRFQVIAVSAMFAFAVAINAFGSLSHILRTREFMLEIAMLTGDQRVIPLALAIAGPVVFAMGGALCLVFMWHIRRIRTR